MSRTLIIAVLVFAVGNQQTPAGGYVGQPLVPEFLKRDVSPEGIAYLEKLRKRTPFGANDFNLDALRAGMGSRREPTIKGVKLIKVKVGEIPCEWVVAAGADPDLRLLYLHGEGFVSGSGGYYLAQAAHISAAAKCAVLLPDYRLAPEHRFPAGLDDCVEAHKWMVANGPNGSKPARATFVAGDSAGGNLTLATLLALRDRKLTLPAGGIPISPCTDFTLASDSLKTVFDPIISAKTMPIFRDHYLGKTDPRNRLASPVFGDYRGIPPLLIQVGEHEMLRDDSIRVAKKARADGASVRLEVWPGMFHVFQSHEPLLPDARDAIDHIAEFIRSSTKLKEAKETPVAKEMLLFDFEKPADLNAWSNLKLPDAKQEEPAVKMELSAENATRGKHSMKLTFAGGRWPTITTTDVPEDWMPYWTFRADVTAGRPCLIGFTVLQEKSQRGGGWDPTVSRWTKTAFLKPGKNTVTGTVHDSNNYSINTKLGKVVRFEIFMYAPHEGETIFVDNIRLSTAKEAPTVETTKFPVLGTDMVVSGVRELGMKLKDRWTKPEVKSLDQVEGELRTLHAELKKKHPTAILAVLRDGEKGFDPAHPDKVYAGWKDAYWSSHGPDGMTLERTDNIGKQASHEIFMRHRSPLMRVDLASVPTGSKILAARLVIIRAHDKFIKDHNPEQANMWVVEPCNRPWEEYEVNAYEYAKDKFWKAIGGMYYGDDPDFLPMYLAHGPSQGKVNTWDFTHAVRFWTEGKHANHGFMLHGNAGDWFPRAHSREAAAIGDRPAVWVIYEPKK